MNLNQVLNKAKSNALALSIIFTINCVTAIISGSILWALAFGFVSYVSINDYLKTKEAIKGLTVREEAPKV